MKIGKEYAQVIKFSQDAEIQLSRSGRVTDDEEKSSCTDGGRKEEEYKEEKERLLFFVNICIVQMQSLP
jgi:hypothetical protein